MTCEMQDAELTAPEKSVGGFFHGAGMSDNVVVTMLAVSFWLGVNVLIATFAYVIVDWGL